MDSQVSVMVFREFIRVFTKIISTDEDIESIEMQRALLQSSSSTKRSRDENEEDDFITEDDRQYETLVQSSKYQL